MIVYVPNSLILHVNKSSCERECAPTRHGTGEGAGPAPTCVPQWHSRNATSRMTRHHIRLPGLNACRLKSPPPPSQGVPRERSFLRENPAPSESSSSNSQQHTPHQPHSRPHPKTSHYPTPQRTSPKHTRSQTLGVEAPCAPRCRTSVARIMWHPPEGLWGGEGARTGGEGGWGDEAGCHRTPGAPPLTPSISPSHPA